LGIELLDKGAQRLGIYLGATEREKFLLYFQLIQEWNQKINLVSYHDQDQLYRQHFLDSLMCSLGCDLKNANRVVDLGSGAGFPAIPLKICFPNLDLLMVDSRKKRCIFLQRVIERLNLKGCDVIWERIEAIGHQEEYRGVFDCAFARAVASLSVLAELGLPLVKCKGKLIALKGYDIQQEIDAAARALDILHARVEKVIPYSFPGERGRHVVVVKKEQETPYGFPRKAGMPAKNPL
jgi:16S rRNA (guanine527-N7)-methyltransferase